MTSTTRQDMQIPADAATREAIRHSVQAYCRDLSLVPPLTLSEIEALAENILQTGQIDPRYRGFVSVLAGNEAWRDVVAATPYDRRVLLLPKCARHSKQCPAVCDDLGVLCEACGACDIGAVQQDAEALGYAVLVAEGNTAVAALLGRGEADAVVGVSCLAALEKSFQPLIRHAIPGLAVPLLCDGCVDTRMDAAWVREVVHLRDAALPPPPRLDMRVLREEVNRWFTAEALRPLLQEHGTATEAIAAEWLARDGKRWRPLLCASVCQALMQPASAAAVRDVLRRVAIAVECFHKASLVHDDIEDDEAARYGVPTVHHVHGVPVAINAGDLLIGEGYRLIAGCGAAPAQIQRMLATAAAGHRALCLGQGEELLQRQDLSRLSPDEVLAIFRRKTVPSFEVALLLGAICADASEEVLAVLSAFSDALGVAYQIRDDLEDAADDAVARAGAPARLSLLTALSCGRDPAEATRLARELLKTHRTRALQALQPLRHAVLKALLFRLVAKILGSAADT